MTSTPRIAHLARKTFETDISLRLSLDGTGRHDVQTGIPFLDHLLTHVAVHGLMDLEVMAQGDLHVDEHHTAEDVAICFGRALDEALAGREGICRMGSALVPMDEALAQIVIDLSGRPYAVIDCDFSGLAIGGLGTDMIHHFLESLAFQARMNLHAHVLYGRNDHHKAEALFKAFGRALREAVRFDPGRAGVPSTKGAL